MTLWTTETTQDVIRVANLAADAAKSKTLQYFRSEGLLTENKELAGFDPVTAADRAAENAIREILAVERPDDAIIGEEYGSSGGSSGLTWVLDPIDGTRGYISGTPTWGTLISVSDETGPAIGLIDQPYIGERFIGGPGLATFSGPLGQRRLSTRGTKSLADATLLTTFPEVGSEIERSAFMAVNDRVKLTRYGMDCYGYALLAAGQVDLVIEAGLQAYDIHAPIAVIEAAGGIVTNWEGRPAHDGGRVIAAANSTLHDQALSVLRGVIDG